MAPDSRPPGCRLRPIRTGTALLSPGYVYRPEAKSLSQALGRGVPASSKLRCPLGAFLIEHPSAGPVLVDTGMHPVVASEPRKNMGVIGAIAMKGVKIGSDENAPARLREWGFDPAAIELVVMTHLHPDHSSAMAAFPQATFVATKAEWEAAHGRLAPLSGYVRGHFPPRSSMRLLDFADSEPFEDLTRTVDLLGDGSVRLVATPGHSAGHMSVLIEAEDGPVFLLADAVYTLRNLRESILPWRTADDADSEESMRQIRAYARAHPEVPLIPTHDPEVWQEFDPEGPIAAPSARLSRRPTA